MSFDKTHYRQIITGVIITIYTILHVNKQWKVEVKIHIQACTIIINWNGQDYMKQLLLHQY